MTTAGRAAHRKRPHPPICGSRKHDKNSKTRIPNRRMALNSVEPVELDAFAEACGRDWDGVAKAGRTGHQPSLSSSALASAVAFSMA
jgi:hypothetical protein